MPYLENPSDPLFSIDLVPQWSARYPDPQVLRREADAMSSAYVGALREAIPDEQVEGIYLKGSATKAWESPLDYVPELSDVDIHLLLREDAPARYLGTIEQTLTIQARAERLFIEQVGRPLHFPRPQLMLANDLFSKPNFVPSPPSVVKVVYGKPYPALAMTEAQVRAFDLENLLFHEQYLADLPLSSIDNPGPHIRVSLRGMSWRVSPTGSRVLHSLGPRYEQAWGTNRTGIVRLLLQFGQEELAIAVSSFYVSAWDYFLSGYADSDAGRAALLAGARVLRLGIKFAKEQGATIAPEIESD